MAATMINSDKGSKLYLGGLTFVAVLGGLLFGYDTAVISGAEKALEAFFHNPRISFTAKGGTGLQRPVP